MPCTQFLESKVTDEGPQQTLHLVLCSGTVTHKQAVRAGQALKAPHGTGRQGRALQSRIFAAVSISPSYAIWLPVVALEDRPRSSPTPPKQELPDTWAMFADRGFGEHGLLKSSQKQAKFLPLVLQSCLWDTQHMSVLVELDRDEPTTSEFHFNMWNFVPETCGKLCLCVLCVFRELSGRPFWVRLFKRVSFVQVIWPLLALLKEKLFPPAETMWTTLQHCCTIEPTNHKHHQQQVWPSLPVGQLNFEIFQLLVSESKASALDVFFLPGQLLTGLPVVHIAIVFAASRASRVSS